MADNLRGGGSSVIFPAGGGDTSLTGGRSVAPPAGAIVAGAIVAGTTGAGTISGGKHRSWALWQAPIHENALSSRSLANHAKRSIYPLKKSRSRRSAVPGGCASSAVTTQSSLLGPMARRALSSGKTAGSRAAA
jgi:hypothetical protein